LPPEQRRNYKNVFDALGRMIKEEGLFSLWRGCTPTALRAMSLNAGMLSTYGEVKERLNKIKGTHDDASTKITYFPIFRIFYVISIRIPG
jgi:solute carrier family 25 oxoglutarate transporter 11